ncbi:STAS domain-containing protein [Siminovitchia fortis]|uniref:STAS domain-containing protein n=1 Tax=Siminovitchia fortis TaxID=254758 RepID=UPI0011A5C070|nr:STAS domain-containing protein [Siminovitchia fortis]
MSDLDMELYGYLVDRIESISNEWLTQRRKEHGSIYSVDADKETEAYLKEQNQLTNLTVTSSLLEDKREFEKNKEKWVRLVAKSRVSSNTPIPEVLEALSNARKVYWRFVESFLELNSEKVTQENLLKWEMKINRAFDELSIEFSQAYNLLMNNKLSAQSSLIDELSAPVIKINEEFGVLPLVGDIDTWRAKKIYECVPVKCMEINISRLYIDLSGVSIIDTMVAHQIYQLSQTLDLLGVKSTITGIRPEIAQTAIQLGLDFSKIDTYSSLQQALKDKFLIVAEQSVK